MLSACISGCHKKDDDLTCLSCGRTKDERVLWKNAPEEERPQIFFALVEKARDRMPESDFELWAQSYTKKICQKNT